MIRPLELKDIDSVNVLINDKNYIVNEYELSKKAFVYEKDGKIIAFISYAIFFERAELNYIFVDSKYRRLHIATELMDFMIKNCQEMQVIKIDLEVNSQNEKAINLYKKYDFKIVSIRKKYYNGNDGYIMLKEVR